MEDAKFDVSGLKITQEVLKRDLKLCVLSNDVYEKGDLSGKILIKNSIAKPYKPVFQVYIEDFTLFCVVRGTWEIVQDSVADIDMDPVSYLDDGRTIFIHKGFFKSAVYVYSQLSIICQFLIDNSYINDVVFTGHSSGAAVSCILQLFFKRAYSGLKSQSVGFGTPPFCQSCFYSGESRTYINNNDCISRACVLYGHVEQVRKANPGFTTSQYTEYVERQFGKKDDYYIPGDIYHISGNELVPITRYGVYDTIGSFLDFADHRLDVYIDNLKAIIDAQEQ